MERFLRARAKDASELEERSAMASVTGRVVQEDGQTGQSGLPNVPVFVNGIDASGKEVAKNARTDSKGNYRFTVPDAPSGTPYNLDVRFLNLLDLEPPGQPDGIPELELTTPPAVPITVSDKGPVNVPLAVYQASTFGGLV